MLNSIEESKSRSREFLERLSMEISLNIVYNSGISDNLPLDYSICGKTFRNIDGLKKICISELEKFTTNRDILLESLEQFFYNIDRKIIIDATNCHLRPVASSSSKRKNKCQLCKSDQIFHTHAKNLFSHSDEIIKFTEDEMKDDNNEEEENFNTNENQLISEENLIENLNREKTNSAERKFLRSSSDLEKLFKILCSMCKNDEKLQEYVKIGKKVIDMYELYKEEFRLCRQFWLTASYQINAYDELEMAKIRMRLREPNETGRIKESYIIEPLFLPQLKYQAINDKKSSEIDLRKKIGQFLYLQNLSKV